MSNLIPEFILEKYEKKQYQGYFVAATLFVDISGFTKMTQNLMNNGKEGAEILSDIINEIFTPAIEAIYKNFGFISTFAGDAFTAIFKNRKYIYAANAAFRIQEIFKKIGKQKTKFGNFELSVKIGISYGKVHWGILNAKSQSSYFFKGKAIDNCAKCQKEAGRGEIVFDDYFKEKLNNAKFIQKRERLYQLLDVEIKKNLPPIKKKNKTASESAFNLPYIANLRSSGEFRDIISCFISFEDKGKWKFAITKLIDLAHSYGGYLNKIDFGDKGGNVLVLFGAPVGKEKLYSRACGFALAVRDTLNLKLRMGLTFGLVYAGFIGSKLRAEYTALGMVVNLSARFMMRAKYNQIFIDEAIKKNIENNFTVKDLGKIRFKGFENSIDVFLLKHQNKSKKIRFKQLIGREAELKKLTDTIEPINKGKFGGIVYVQGTAGIGKSRLISQLRYNLTSENTKKYNWFYLPCDEILQKSFNPFIHFLNEYFNQSKENGRQKNLHNFETKLKSLIDKTYDVDIRDELIRTKAFLAALIGINIKDEEYQKLDAKGRFENTLFAVKNLIKAESLQKPVIIELEDGHWIDSESKKMLNTLIRNIENYPIIIVSSCRLNDDNSLFNFGINDVPQTNIVLEHLERKSCCELVEEKLKGKASEEIFDLIWEKSEGNPFYIEQIIMYLVENNLIDENLNLSDKKFEIPKTINSIIVARIDRLSLELKEVVQTASVLGREFSVRILAKMLKRKAIKNDLSEGSRENIWIELSKINYIFKHALIRETVYEMQLKKQLRELHKLAAQTIENYYKNNLKEHYPDLANHYEKAEINKKAIEYLEKAGDLAKENYQNIEAINFYNRLLNLLGKEKNSEKLIIDILIKRGEIYQIIGKWKNAVTDFKKATEISDNINDLELQAKSYSALGKQYYFQADNDEATKCFNKLLKIGNILNDKKTIALAITKMATINYSLGKINKSMELYQKGLKIFTEIDYKPGISITIGNIGLVYKHLREYKKAMEYFEKRRKTAEELGDDFAVANALGNMSSIYKIYGDFKKAKEYINKKLEVCEKRGDKRAIATALMQLATYYFAQNDFEKAKEFVLKAMNINNEIGDKKGLLNALVNIGVIYSIEGQYDKALTYYNKHLNLARSLKNKNSQTLSYGNIGLIYKVKGDFKKALKMFNKKVDICSEIGDNRGIVNTYQLIGNVYQLLDEFSKAKEYYEKAIELAEKTKFHSKLSENLFFIAEIFYNTKQYLLAKTNNEKSYNIALKIKHNKQISNCKILAEKINFKTGDLNALYNLKVFSSDKNIDNETKALVYYELALMNYEVDNLKEANNYKEMAIKLFKQLHSKTSDVKFTKMIKILRQKFVDRV